MELVNNEQGTRNDEWRSFFHADEVIAQGFGEEIERYRRTHS